jgi:hypothetical protein
MIERRSTWFVVFPLATSALFSACAPELTTSDGEGGGTWGESSASSNGSSNASSSSSGGGAGNSSSSSGGQSPTCTDQVKNGTETDVDCGGTMCLRCTAGQSCFSDLDCDSGFCSAMDTCAPATCTDNLKNGNETAVDCGGGTCPGCATGQTCQVDSDCASGQCVGNFCVQGKGFIGATTLDVKNAFTMSPPAGAQYNDLLMFFIAHGGGTDTSLAPTGWTVLENGSGPGNDPRLDVYYQIYSSTTTFDFALANSDGSAILAAFRGMNYGAKGTLQNSWSDSITTLQTSTLLFVALQNGGGEIPALPPGFTSIGLGNGNTRSMRVGYVLDQPASSYMLTAVAAAGEILPSGTLAIALY